MKNMGLGSGIRKKTYPGSRVKKAPDPGSGSATLGGRTCAVRNYGQRFYYFYFILYPIKNQINFKRRLMEF
jgi:hypothetical protein